MQGAPEDPEDEEHVILHLFPEKQVEETSHYEPEVDPKLFQEPELQAGELQWTSMLPSNIPSCSGATFPI